MEDDVKPRVDDKPRLMIVEDQALVARDIRARLTRMDYDVVAVCRNPDDAESTALSLRPDLILMDVNLNADRDGIEVIQAIHQVRPIPVIFCTASSCQEMMDRTDSIEHYGHILKPFSDRELELNIDLVLGQRAVRAKLDAEIGDRKPDNVIQISRPTRQAADSSPSRNLNDRYRNLRRAFPKTRAV